MYVVNRVLSTDVWTVCIVCPASNCAIHALLFPHFFRSSRSPAQLENYEEKNKCKESYRMIFQLNRQIPHGIETGKWRWLEWGTQHAANISIFYDLIKWSSQIMCHHWSNFHTNHLKSETFSMFGICRQTMQQIPEKIDKNRCTCSHYSIAAAVEF